MRLSALLPLSLIRIVTSDAACTTLTTAGVSPDLHSNAACGTQMPLAEALVVSKGTDTMCVADAPHTGH